MKTDLSTMITNKNDLSVNEMGVTEDKAQSEELKKLSTELTNAQRDLREKERRLMFPLFPSLLPPYP